MDNNSNKPTEENNEKKMTKAEIMKVKDRVLRRKLIAENMDLFERKEGK